MGRQKIVEDDVNDDSCEAAPFGSEEGSGTLEGGVVIGKAVEMAMHHDSVKDFVGKGSPERFRSALHKVAQEISDAGSVAGCGENEMGEEVDARSLPCVGSQSKSGRGGLVLECGDSFAAGDLRFAPVPLCGGAALAAVGGLSLGQRPSSYQHGATPHVGPGCSHGALKALVIRSLFWRSANDVSLQPTGPM